jgi:hypothetical protein
MPFFIGYPHSIASGNTGRIMRNWHKFCVFIPNFALEEAEKNPGITMIVKK